jgi:hypothetical protein
MNRSTKNLAVENESDVRYKYYKVLIRCLQMTAFEISLNFVLFYFRHISCRDFTKFGGHKRNLTSLKYFGFYEISFRIVSFMTEISSYERISQLLTGQCI